MEWTKCETLGCYHNNKRGKCTLGMEPGPFPELEKSPTDPGFYSNVTCPYVRG